MSPYTIAWLLWGAAFFVIEGLAIRDKRAGDTLSEHVWKFGRKATFAGRGMLAGFLMALNVHLVACPFWPSAFFC